MRLSPNFDLTPFFAVDGAVGAYGGMASGTLYQQNLAALENSGNYYELYKAVMDLPIKYREPIILHYYFDYTQREAARIMSISDAALRARLMRARDKLRAALGEEVEL